MKSLQNRALIVLLWRVAEYRFFDYNKQPKATEGIYKNNID